MKQTAMQKLLKQIVLKKVKDSVYLLPAITDVQINELLKEEEQQIEHYYDKGFKDAMIKYRKD